MSDLITAYLFRKDDFGAWLIFGEFDLAPVAVPRIGEAFTRREKQWRVVDVIWNFESPGDDPNADPADPPGYSVDLHIEPETH